MTIREFTDIDADGSTSRTDAERLKLADQALALVEAEINELDFDGDDLSYLMEILRLGVQRALTANEESPDFIHTVTCGDRAH